MRDGGRVAARVSGRVRESHNDVAHHVADAMYRLRPAESGVVDLDRGAGLFAAATVLQQPAADAKSMQRKTRFPECRGRRNSFETRTARHDGGLCVCVCVCVCGDRATRSVGKKKMYGTGRASREIVFGEAVGERSRRIFYGEAGCGGSRGA